MNQYNQDQTVFANQEPLLEDLEKVQSPPPEQPVEPKKPPKLLFIAAAAVLVLVASLAIIFLLQPKNPVATLPTPSPQTDIPVELTPLEARISSLEEDLDSADPTRLPFLLPPVDYEIVLD